jgi:DNA-directed RNA polymerase I and III subunit RPAC1
MAHKLDNSLVMEDFVKNLKVEIKSLTADDMVFDLIGVDAAIANAFRRILIAEVRRSPVSALSDILVVPPDSRIEV